MNFRVFITVMVLVMFAVILIFIGNTHNEVEEVRAELQEQTRTSVQLKKPIQVETK